jgi:fermentation-respiration switch protein FrsA (DUF1100 family)
MSVAIFVGLLLASLLVILWLAQERIVFQPPRGFSPHDGAEAQRIEYLASDGQPLVGFLVEPSEPRSGLLICFHGNADLAAWQCAWAAEVARRSRHTVFLAEYRGYFGLQGKPTYRTTQLDADAAYRAALEATESSIDSVSLFGHSLGSAVAAELATRVPARALLLQAPFSSARAMGRLVIGRPLLLLWSRLSRVHFNTTAVVESLTVPVSAVHGERDRIVPVRMGESVFTSARVKGGLLILPDAGHNNIPDVGGEEYWSWVTSALAGKGYSNS